MYEHNKCFSHVNIEAVIFLVTASFKLRSTLISQMVNEHCFPDGIVSTHSRDVLAFHTYFYIRHIRHTKSGPILVKRVI